MIKAYGWPVAPEYDEKICEAAWLIAQHAISKPAFQRMCLGLIKDNPLVPAWYRAYLEDRIRVFEGRPQVYGTNHDWDESGELSPTEIEDPLSVDQKRLAVGLKPLAETTQRLRKEAAAAGERAPGDRLQHKKEFQAWAKRVGWRP